MCTAEICLAEINLQKLADASERRRSMEIINVGMLENEGNGVAPACSETFSDFCPLDEAGCRWFDPCPSRGCPPMAL